MSLSPVSISSAGDYVCTVTIQFSTRGTVDSDNWHVHLANWLVPNSLMVRGYEPGREDHKFDPRLGNFFLSM